MVAFALRLVLAAFLVLGGLDVCCWANRPAPDAPVAAHEVADCCKRAATPAGTPHDRGMPSQPCCSQCIKSWMAGGPSVKAPTGSIFATFILDRCPFQSREGQSLVIAASSREPFRPPASTLLRLHCALTV